MGDDSQTEFGKLIAKAWSDAAFKQRLLSDPDGALAELGIHRPAGMEGVRLKVVENTVDTVHLVLPAPPAEGEIGDEALDALAGGFCIAFCYRGPRA